MYNITMDDTLENAIREHFDLENAETIEFSTRSRIKDLLKRDMRCICEYKTSLYEVPSKKTGENQKVFKIKKKYGNGVDVAITEGEKHICKECGGVLHAIDADKLYNHYNTKYVSYEELGLTSDQIQKVKK